MAGFKYRPICDLWILARCKYKNGIKRYGGYLGGFPERARALLGCKIDEPVLHVCGGLAKEYPYKRGFGPNDKTSDLDPSCKPDFLTDARKPFPFCPTTKGMWAGILIDPPYTEEDSKVYPPGPEVFPTPNLLIKNAFEVLPVGGRCGMIHYIVPSPPKNSVFVACVGIICGYNNRCRVYTVFEKL